MGKPKIMRRYGVRAEPSKGGGGFVGLYAIPGKDEQLARDDDGSVAVFDQEDEAIAAAAEDMVAALNARQIASWKRNYRRMTGAELAVALAELELSPSEFATIDGTSQQRVMQWIDGEEDIPYHVTVLIALLRLPDGVEMAWSTTEANMVKRALEQVRGVSP